MLDEFFESEEVKAALATSAVAGTMAGPRTPGTAFVLGHHTLGNIGGVKGVWGWSRGGMGGISEAIAAAARHYGAQIRTNAEVSRIVTLEGRAVGVTLADGTQVDARVVLSNADPKRTFLRLVRAEDLPVEFARAIARIRFESSSFKLHLALRELPDFGAIPGTTVQPHHKTIIDLAPSMDYLERAYDDAKRGRPSRWRPPHPMEAEDGRARGGVSQGAILPSRSCSVRPIRGWAWCRTPTRGLSLCGAGAHPAGGGIAAAAHNAAMAVLEDGPR